MFLIDTINGARKALHGLLRFGDTQQIAAVRFVESAEAVADMIGDCPHGSAVCWVCEGAGGCPTCGNKCQECGGTGVDGGCQCFAGISPRHLVAGLAIYRERQDRADAAREASRQKGL